MKTFKLNFDFPFLNLNGSQAIYAGEEGKVIIAGQVLGNLLANSVNVPVKLIHKYYEWGKILYQQTTTTDPGSFLELDQTDFDTLQKFVEDEKTLSASGKAQLLRVFRDAEKVADASTGDKS